MTRLARRSDGIKLASWAVTVERNGESVVTLASNCYSGRDLSVEDEIVIWLAAVHLLSFIGKGQAETEAPEGAELNFNQSAAALTRTDRSGSKV